MMEECEWLVKITFRSANIYNRNSLNNAQHPPFQASLLSVINVCLSQSSFMCVSVAVTHSLSLSLYNHSYPLLDLASCWFSENRPIEYRYHVVLEVSKQDNLLRLNWWSRKGLGWTDIIWPDLSCADDGPNGLVCSFLLFFFCFLKIKNNSFT